MTELQPTEIELSRKKQSPSSKKQRRLLISIVLTAVLVITGTISVLMGKNTSISPEMSPSSAQVNVQDSTN